MAKVVERKEVEINSTKFPLKGLLTPVLVSNFPDKIVTGDYGASSNPLTSNWVLGDATDGIGVKEMDETIHEKRIWWGDVNIDYKGQICLPDLATAIDFTASLILDVTITNSDMELATGWTGGSRNDVQAHGGTYAWLTGTSTTAYQSPTWSDSYQSKTFIFGVFCYAIEASKSRLSIYDGQTTSYSSYHSGGSSWELLCVAKTLAANADQLKLSMINSSSTTASYWDDACRPATGSVVGFENFNSELYLAYSNALLKLNGTGDGFTGVGVFPTTIVDIISSVNSCLYISQASDNYFYMSTAEVFLETDETTADLWVEWDDKLFHLDHTDNQIYYDATPNAASPGSTANGTLDAIPPGAVKALYTDQNSAGTVVIFAATTNGLWGHDFTNAKWTRTSLKATHPNGGKGAGIWQDAAYFSAGLDVLRYQTGTIDLITSVGLTFNDGIPAEYNGEIVKFIQDNLFKMYVLVDSTQVTGTATSWVAGFNGEAWSVIWVAPSTEGVMTSGIVSSKFAYRLYFNHGSAVYAIPIDRGARNPNLLSTHTFATSGKLFSSWNDGVWRAGNKRANQVRVGHSGVSADETLKIYYRTDHSSDDLDLDLSSSHWTLLGTITSGTETTYSFGSGVGLAYKEIQFRVDFARGDTTTNTPVLKYLTLEYNKLIPKSWGWQMTLDCSTRYGTNSPSELITALKAAAETETLVTFVYETTTYYVEFVNVNGQRLTGDVKKGEYYVFLREVMKPNSS